MRIAMIVLAGAVLAGCQDGQSGPVEEDLAQADSASDGGQTPFFVGRWAAEEGLCESAAWEFSSTRISTPGHVVCTFEEVDYAADVYDIAATCTAEGPPEQHQLRISYAQSAGGLLVEGAPFQPVGLVECQ